MEVRVLGTAAGGGFPQWNCACNGCEASRADAMTVPPRLQSGVAIRKAGGRWILVNASPDVGRQIEQFLRPGFLAANPRDSPVERVFLTNADLDHALGLFQLREGGPIRITAPQDVRRSLTEGLNLEEVLGCYAPVEWRESPTNWEPSGITGIDVRCHVLAGTESPRYGPPGAPGGDHAVGYVFRDTASGATVGIFPDVAVVTPKLRVELAACDLVLFDGTFWTYDEMVRLGLTDRDAAAMGHVPISGPDGSLDVLSSLPDTRSAYLHVNNTNPILNPASPARQMLTAAGVEVAADGAQYIL